MSRYRFQNLRGCQIHVFLCLIVIKKIAELWAFVNDNQIFSKDYKSKRREMTQFFSCYRFWKKNFVSKLFWQSWDSLRRFLNKLETRVCLWLMGLIFLIHLFIYFFAYFWRGKNRQKNSKRLLLLQALSLLALVKIKLMKRNVNIIKDKAEKVLKIDFFLLFV